MFVTEAMCNSDVKMWVNSVLAIQGKRTLLGSKPLSHISPFCCMKSSGKWPELFLCKEFGLALEKNLLCMHYTFWHPAKALLSIISKCFVCV